MDEKLYGSLHRGYKKKKSGLIWIQTVSKTDCIPEIFLFDKS